MLSPQTIFSVGSLKVEKTCLVLVLGLWMERGKVGDALVCEEAQHKLRRKKRKRVSRRVVELLAEPLRRTSHLKCPSAQPRLFL